MTNILILAPAYPPLIGGAETYIQAVAESLVIRGHRVLVLTDKTSGADSRFECNGLLVRRMSQYQAALSDPTKLKWEQMQFALLSEVKKVLNEEEFEPAVIFTNQGEAAILGSMVKLEYSVPLVSTFHEQNRETYPLGKGRLRFVYQMLPIDKILVASKFYRDKALMFGANPAKLELIYHGVDAAMFSEAPLPFADERRSFRIGLAGRIAPRKCHDFAVHVLQGLRASGLNVTMDFAGEPHSSSREYVDSLHHMIAAADLGTKVRFLGAIPTKEMPRFYRSLDLCIQPSSEEGLGLSVMEASVCGVPVLASDVVGLREVFQFSHIRNRSLIPQDRDLWVREIRDLIEDTPARLELAAEQRAHVIAKFSSENMRRETERAIVNARILA